MADDLPPEPVTADPLAGPSPFSPPRPTRPRRWDVALVVAAGGAIGGGCRYGVNQLLPTPAGGFPWSTFLENVSGCFLLAIVSVFLLEVLPPHRYARPFLGVGILGGYTTFSTYTSDARVLLQAGEGPTAIAYLFATVAVGLLAVIAGLSATRVLTGVTPPHKRRERP
ncbi:MAG: CrcB family protein [Candidatus Nanopelagicales bacterium]